MAPARAHACFQLTKILFFGRDSFQFNVCIVASRPSCALGLNEKQQQQMAPLQEAQKQSSAWFVVSTSSAVSGLETAPETLHYETFASSSQARPKLEAVNLELSALRFTQASPSSIRTTPASVASKVTPMTPIGQYLANMSSPETRKAVKTTSATNRGSFGEPGDWDNALGN